MGSRLIQWLAEGPSTLPDRSAEQSPDGSAPTYPTDLPVLPVLLRIFRAGIRAQCLQRQTIFDCSNTPKRKIHYFCSDSNIWL